MKKIDIYTNLVKEGWSAKSLDLGVGGSEEKLIELARELAKDYEVTIYHNGEHGLFEGVNYRDHTEFRPWMTRHAFISFKVKDIWKKSIGATKRIHWTTEIEPEWMEAELSTVNRISTISNYHKNRMPTKSEKVQADYLWADLDRLEANKVDKEEGTMLYCSSFDRGLEELLEKWEIIKKELKLKRLYITYGWDFMDRVIAFNPGLVTWKEKMTKLMKQDGVELVGRVGFDEMSRYYWKSQYWVLPLNNPDSELFCINAIKAQYCESIPVVRRIGALQETVNEFIDWDSLLNQKASTSQISKDAIKNNKEHAKKFNMTTAIEKWKKILEG